MIFHSEMSFSYILQTMNFEKYISYSTENFVLDSYFMQWVLHPDAESDLFWNEFLSLYPEKKDEIKEAMLLIESFRIDEPVVPNRALDVEILHESSMRSKHAHTFGRQLLKYAAVFLLVVTMGGIFYYYQFSHRNRFHVEMADSRLFEKGGIVLPDGTISEFETKETQIKQSSSGEITVNDDTLHVSTDMNSDVSAMAQVITPYGKRTQIVLSDGTKIWLNAGTTLSYPTSFSDKSREVYLSGEAFFEVAKDKSRPFHVITGDLRIKVTGTRFNVTSYQNDSFTQAVLVEGKIFASKNGIFSKDVELSPGEIIVLDKSENRLSKQKVDVELYASWINGYLIMRDEPIDEIIKKLERYYDQKIIAENLSQDIRFTGKLNLADDLNKVLQNIAFSAAFSVEYKNDTYIIK